jgi:IS30 family transposase
MFPKAQIRPLMQMLGIKEEKNAVFFLKRLEGWINKNGNTSISIAKGINKILYNIHEKEKNETKKINLDGIKNPLIKKYAKEILELHNQGLGVRRIQKHLYEAHRAKISHSSIYRYLKAQKEAQKA